MEVIKTPAGYKLSTTELFADVVNSGGDAVFVSYYHGLTDGAVAYIKGPVENYNGFKFIEVIDPASFKIRNTETGAAVAFVQEAYVSFFESNLTHGWVSVHLPIVYQISNDKYPVNEDYLTPVISSVTDNNGYIRIVCSGNIASGLNDLDYVKLSDSGIYQIKDAESDSIVTLNVAYTSTLAGLLVGQTVQFHYNNYHIQVRVYAGLNSAHPFASYKPYTLLATLKFIPDENNVVTFDISQILRGNVSGKNNLLGNTLPLNLDAFTQFYISYAEAYDQSDGTEIEVFNSGFQADSFEGYAIDSKMPFKSRDINTMSDYVPSTLTPAKWLTLFETPVYLPGKFFDLSWIKNDDGAFSLNINGNILYYPDYGKGVYRLPISDDLLYSEDELCVSITRYSQETGAGSTPTVEALSAFENFSTGFIWTTGANPQVSLSGMQVSRLLGGAISDGCPDIEYQVDFDIDLASTVMGTSRFKVRIYDSAFTQFVEDVFIYNSTGNKTGTASLTPTFQPAYLVFIHDCQFGIDTILDINSFNFTPAMACPPISLTEKQLMEEICIDVIDDICGESFIDADCPDCPGGSSGSGDCLPGILSEGEGYILLE